jgi:hypothetical protein
MTFLVLVRKCPHDESQKSDAGENGDRTRPCVEHSGHSRRGLLTPIYGTPHPRCTHSRAPKAIQGHSTLFKGFWRKIFFIFMKPLKTNHTRPAFRGCSGFSLNLGELNQIKVILGNLSRFQEIKDCLFFIGASLALGGWDLDVPIISNNSNRRRGRCCRGFRPGAARLRPGWWRSIGRATR